MSSLTPTPGSRTGVFLIRFLVTNLWLDIVDSSLVFVFIRNKRGFSLSSLLSLAHKALLMEDNFIVWNL